MGHKGPVLRSRCIGPGRARTQISFNSIQFKLYQRRIQFVLSSVVIIITWDTAAGHEMTWLWHERIQKLSWSHRRLLPLYNLCINYIYIYEMYLHHNHATNMHMRQTCKTLCILQSHSWWTFRHIAITEILESKLSSLRQWRGPTSTFIY
jgi:hypothetical protein